MQFRISKNTFIGWKLFVCASVVVLFLPILALLGNIDTETTSYWQHVKDKLLTEYLFNTFVLVIGTGSLCAVLGVFTAWLVSYNNFKLRRFFEVAFILPMAIPVYIQSYSYASLFDYGGLIPKIVSFVSFGLIDFHLDIMNVWGLIFMYSSVLFPYTYLMLRSSFMLQSNDLQKVCVTLNKSNFHTFFNVILPLSWPALFGSLILIIMEVLNDYGSVKYFGVNTFVVGIFESWFAMGDVGTALKLSFVLIVFVLIILLIEAYSNKNVRYTSNQTQDQNNKFTGVLTTKLSDILIVIAAGLIVVFSLALPIYQLVYWATLNFELLFRDTFLLALKNSLFLAFGVSLFVVFMTVILVFGLSIIDKVRYSRITKMSLIGYTIPGAILSIGIIMLFKTMVAYMPIDSLKIYFVGGGLFSLVFAYFIRFYGVSYNSILSGSSKVPTQYLHSVFSLGKSLKTTMLQVYLPLIAPSILSAFIFVFVDTIKELPLTLILRPFNFDTLSTLAYQSASDELVDQSAIYSLFILLISLVPTLFLNKIIRKKV